MELLPHFCCIKVFECIIENIVSHLFRFRSYVEMLTRLQLFFRSLYHQLFYVMVRINICCLARNAISSFLAWSYSVKAWKLFVTKILLESNNKFWSAVLSAIWYFFSVWDLWRSWELSTIQSPSRTTFVVMSKIKLCSLGTKLFTSNFPVAIEAKHLWKRSRGDCSVKTWSVMQLDSSNAKNGTAKKCSKCYPIHYTIHGETK